MIRLWAIAIIVAAICAFAPSDLVAPSNTMRIEPPEHYREVFDQAVKCSGKYKPYSRIKFYLVPGKEWQCEKNGMHCIGEYQKPNRILIASEWKTTDWVVRHEMIHYVTGLPHDGGVRDTTIWGRQCHSMWGFLPTDSTYIP